MKIIGREYTLWLVVLATGLNLLVGFKLPIVSEEQAAWIYAAINSVVMIIAAWHTRPIAPQLFTYSVASIAGLVTAYGFEVTPEQISLLQLFVLSVAGLFTRGQVSPSEDAHRTGVLGNKVTTDNYIPKH